MVYKSKPKLVLYLKPKGMLHGVKRKHPQVGLNELIMNKKYD